MTKLRERFHTQPELIRKREEGTMKAWGLGASLHLPGPGRSAMVTYSALMPHVLEAFLGVAVFGS